MAYDPRQMMAIGRMGGWQSLPLNGFWTMYDRELWAMGYPKCL